MEKLKKITRRDFLKTSAFVTVSAFATPTLLEAQSPDQAAKSANSQRLIQGWEYYRGSLGGPWEVFRGGKAGDQVRWQKVELPHCFNARDAVDPDRTYFRGQGW